MEPTMLAEVSVGLAIAVMPFLAIVGLLGVSGYLRRRERLRVTRQIGVTDALDRELGTTAAAEVGRDWRGGWIVSVSVPFERDETVGAVARIAYDFFAKSHPMEVPRLRILLTAREPTLRQPGRLSSVAGRAADNLPRVA